MCRGGAVCPLSAEENHSGKEYDGSKSGVLNGRYRVTFTNGNHITFVSHGETTLLSEKGKLKLQSHLDREEYVARVLDREAKSTPPEAAKAMTVAIRTFLQQNANREGDCLTIPDSSATQRVSASPATTWARTMTAWTQDLIYAGDPVHYHGSRATEGTLSWRQATAQAGQGERYDQILAFAYPDNSLSRWGAPRSTCQLLPKAKAWLAKKMPQWRRILQAETGYNEPDVFAVCRLVSGFPYTDRQQKRLFIRNFFTLQDRLDLTHEYLHLAFDGYPTGLDEKLYRNADPTIINGLMLCERFFFRCYWWRFRLSLTVKVCRKSRLMHRSQAGIRQRAKMPVFHNRSITRRRPSTWQMIKISQRRSAAK